MKLTTITSTLFFCIFYFLTSAQTFDKTYDEPYFNEIELLANGYRLHNGKNITALGSSSIMQLETGLDGELLNVQSGTFLLPFEGDFFYTTSPIILNPSAPFIQTEMNWRISNTYRKTLY